MSTALNLKRLYLHRSFGGLVFDAVFNEYHESTLQVTANPVDTGRLIHDHAFLDPKRVTIQAGVSDTPVNVFGSFTALGDQRSVGAFESLLALQSLREPFDIQTGLKLYKNMICTSIRTEQHVDNSSVLEFVADCQEVIITNTQTTKYNTKRKPGTPQNQASPVSDKGIKAVKEVSKPAAKVQVQTKYKAVATREFFGSN